MKISFKGIQKKLHKLFHKCDHKWVYVRTIHGDEINLVNYRELWRCTLCGAMQGQALRMIKQPERKSKPELMKEIEFGLEYLETLDYKSHQFILPVLRKIVEYIKFNDFTEEDIDKLAGKKS